MRKFNHYLSISALAVLVAFSSCKKDETEETPKTCADEVYPTTTGTSTVAFKNFPSGTATVKAGDIIAIAVDITKSTANGAKRPQKLRVYETECDKAKGDLKFFAGQPKTNNAGDEIDLANTDDPQTRTITYTVPTGKSPIYLNFEVDESGGAYTYKQLVLNVSGSGIVDTHTGITLGGQSNTANGSRMSSALGYVYKACEIPQNLDYIDIVYAVSLNGTNKSYLCSNPARSTAATNADNNTSIFGGLSFTANYSSTCQDDNGLETGSYSTGGGKATYFKLHTANDFDTADNTTLTNLTVSTSDNQYVEITSTSTNNVFEFRNENGKKGLIRINSGTLNNTSTTINVDVKVQR
ncbi:MAG: hypothetical protein MUF42_03905 [Cytophagaceae bacterium]|jgi:hypothetical protein|nr:hypothetical protein [Cytophagaceae bacterium]